MKLKFKQADGIADGPQVPVTTPVSLVKDTPTAVPTVRRPGLHRLQQGAATTWADGRRWAIAADLDDEAAEAAVLAQRARAVANQRRLHTTELRKLRNEERAARVEVANTGMDPDRHPTVRQAVAQLAAAEALTPTDDARPVTALDLQRIRWTRRVSRCAMVAAAAGGTVLALAHSPGLTALAIPAALVWLWRASRPREGDTPAEEGHTSTDLHSGPIPEAEEPEFVTPGAAVADAGPSFVADRADEDPLPIEDAINRAAVIETVKRALLSEGLAIAEVSDAQRFPWGWQAIVRLAKGKPADLIAKLPELETALDLPVGGLRPQPMRARRSRVVLRMVLSDPFADMGPAPERAPNSLKMRTKASVAIDMNGKPFRLSLMGLNVVFVAMSGGGKSAVMRAIADATTACEDVINIDLDPGGNGLAPYAEVMNVRAVGPEAMDRIERTLEYLLAIAKARPHLFARYGMGDNWKVSPDRPGFQVYMDEYPQASARAKELAVALLRVIRKARIGLLLASQDGTKAALGAAVADSVSLRMMGPSRHKDITLVFGEGAIADGWRPDRLHPAEGDPADPNEPGDAGDASCVYIKGAGVKDPILHKFPLISPTEGEARAAERKKAGRPAPDDESLKAAGIRREWWDMLEAGGLPPALTSTDAYLATLPPLEDDPEPLEPEQARLLRDVLTVMDGDRAHYVHLGAFLAAHNPALYGGWNARAAGSALRAAGLEPVDVRVDGKPNKGVTREAVQARLDTGEASATDPATA